MLCVVILQAKAKQPFLMAAASSSADAFTQESVQSATLFVETATVLFVFGIKGEGSLLRGQSSSFRNALQY